MNQQRICVITDTGTDTPADFCAKHDVRVVPLRVNYSDGSSYESGVDITTDEIVARFGQEVPKTSLPSPERIADAFAQAKADGYVAAVFVSISSGLSATCETARMVARTMEDFPVAVVDTRSIGVAAGLVVMEAVRQIEAGVPFSSLPVMLEITAKSTSVFFAVRERSITIDGQDVRDVTQKSLRQSIGLVQQDVYLFDGTIAENIAYGRPDASAQEIRDAARRANIADFIEGLPDGYETRVGERGARLSGGQKQRIAIARVFLKNPPILIFDEATSALDNESERAVQASLSELAQGRTTLVIAHRLSTIKNADEIVTMEDGQVSERGTHEELLAKNGTYARYYRMQFAEGKTEAR